MGQGDGGKEFGEGRSTMPVTPLSSVLLKPSETQVGPHPASSPGVQAGPTTTWSSLSMADPYVAQVCRMRRIKQPLMLSVSL